MRWLESVQVHLGALVSRLQLGASAAAKVDHLERALSEKAGELERLSAANEAGQRRIDAIEKELEAGREVERKLSVSAGELAQRIRALEDDNERKERSLGELANVRTELTQRAKTLEDENEQKQHRLAELSKEMVSLERRIVETEEGRLLYGEQKAKEVKRALAERIGRELEDLPEIAHDTGTQTLEVLRVRFRRLIALLKENGILDPSQGATRR
jgi:chromosome segregation ATPase